MLFLIMGGSLLALVLVLEFISHRVGQTVPYEEAAREQVGDPSLLWNDGDSYFPAFKLARMAQARPDVVVMGQSRMIQFRSAMFHPYSFYNFSKLAWTFGVSSELWRKLPVDYRPKVVLFSLDFFSLNPRFLADYADTLPPSPQSALLRHLAALRDTYKLFYMDPSLLLAGRHDAAGQPCIGLYAAGYGDGLRLDGSETLSFAGFKTAGRNSDLASTIRLNRAPINYGDAVSAKEMARFETYVDLVRASGATPIAIQMPIYGPAMRSIEQDPHYGILKDFRSLVASGYFERHGTIFLDYSNFPPYSDDYRYFIDVFHPTEAACAAVVLKMALDPRVKAVLPDLDTSSLQRKLDENRDADQHVYLYHNEF
jgi:hypothetical protein